MTFAYGPAGRAGRPSPATGTATAGHHRPVQPDHLDVLPATASRVQGPPTWAMPTSPSPTGGRRRLAAHRRRLGPRQGRTPSACTTPPRRCSICETPRRCRAPATRATPTRPSYNPAPSSRIPVAGDWNGSSQACRTATDAARRPRRPTTPLTQVAPAAGDRGHRPMERRPACPAPAAAPTSKRAVVVSRSARLVSGPCRRQHDLHRPGRGQIRLVRRSHSAAERGVRREDNRACGPSIRGRSIRSTC